jgi:glycine cleavage system H protein
LNVDGCDLPDDRSYDFENDVWLRLEGDGPVATLGLTSLLASFAGRFTTVTFRPLEGSVAAGRSVATVESLRYTGAVRLPLPATILVRNREVERRPRLLNDRPYDEGWIVRVQLADPAEVPRRLESASAVEARVRERIAERRIRCYPASPDAELYEVGVECSAVLVRLDEEVARRQPGEVVLLVTDDPTSPIEMVRWSDRSGHSVIAHRREETFHHFLIRREADPRPRRP